MSGAPAFIWCDLETTGLDAQRDAILALGLLITDAQMRELARAEWVIQCDADHPARVGMSDYVREMHTKNGLLQRCDTVGIADFLVQEFACDFLDLHLGIPAEKIKERPPMAGNSVSFDREFVREQMPELAMRFNYRLLDVSTLKVLALATVPGAREWDDSRPDPEHTPLADLRSSICELNHWRQVLRT